MKKIFLRIIFAFLASSAASVVGAVGFQTLEKDGLTSGVWYPSDTAEAAEAADELGPFDVSHALETVLAQKWLRDVDPPGFVRDIPDVHYSLPFINGNIALVAPVGQGVSIDEKLFQAKRVLVVGLDGDIVTKPKFHAERLSLVGWPDCLLLTEAA